MQKKAKKKNHIFLKLFLIIIILGFVGCGVYFKYFFNKKNFVIITMKQVFHKLPKDEQAPVITASDIIITEGDSVDLLKNVTAIDDVDGEVKVTYDGDYDTKKVGSYKITYKATDESGNISNKEITLTVKAVVKPANTQKNRVDFTTSKGYKGYTENGLTYIDGVLIVNKTYSLPSTYGNGLTKATQGAFNEMRAAAGAVGIEIHVGSGFRSYSTQKGLYNSYVNRDGKAKADTYSARAGYSEHQSGLAVDICSNNETACISDGFNGTPTANWLSNNAHLYGFILRYPEGKTNETGYKYESWHFRYVGVDLATKLYNGGNWITLEDYFGITSEYSN